MIKRVIHLFQDDNITPNFVRSQWKNGQPEWWCLKLQEILMPEKHSEFDMDMGNIFQTAGSMKHLVIKWVTLLEKCPGNFSLKVP